MYTEEKIDVLKDFIKDLSSKPLNDTHYINCCINSIMKWEDSFYWKQINLNSKKILEMDIDELCLKEKYHIRSSSEISNVIYEKIYGNKEVVGNDYHGFHLFATLKGISFSEAKTTLSDEFFNDYRISHVWGCTKNIYLNNLPFNYFAIPSFCYCLSDKNNGGDIGKKFRLKLKKSVIKKCQECIILYNRKMIELSESILDNLNNYINNASKKEKKFMSQRLNYILNQFILIPNYNFLINEDSNDLIETGLNIFMLKDNKIEFTQGYKEAKSNKFKYFL